MKRGDVMKKGLFFSCGSVLLVGISLFTFVHPKILGLVAIQDSDLTTIVLNETNKPTENGGQHTLVLPRYDTTLNYTGASLEDGYHVVLSTSGTIERTAVKSFDLQKIKANFTGTLQITTYFEIDGDPVMRFNLENDVTHDLVGNYWVLTALEESKITSFSLGFDCYIEALAPSTETAAINSLTTIDKIEERNSGVYYVLEGTTDIDTGLITKDNLKILETESCFIVAEEVVYTSKTTFAAYFNLNSIQNSSITDSSNVLSFFVHVYLNGKTFDGSTNGDAISSSALTPSSAYSLGDEKYVFLDEFSFSNDTKHMPRINFVFSGNPIISTFENQNSEHQNYFQDTYVFGQGEDLTEEINTTTNSMFDVVLYGMNIAELYVAEDFVLDSDNGAYPITAKSISTTEVTDAIVELKVSFDTDDILDQFYNGITAYSAGNFNWYAHLKIKGEAWSVSSDLKLANTLNDNSSTEVVLWTYQNSTYSVDVTYSAWYNMLYIHFGLSTRINATTHNNVRMEIIENVPYYIVNIGLGGQPLASHYTLWNVGMVAAQVKKEDLGNDTADIYFDLRDLYEIAKADGGTFWPHLSVNGLYKSSNKGNLECNFVANQEAITYDGVTYTTYYEYSMPNIVCSEA